MERERERGSPPIPLDGSPFATLCVRVSLEGREKNSGTREDYDN